MIRQHVLKPRASWIVAGVILVWLLVNAEPGLFAYFTADDVMNMYWAWTTPLRQLAVANVFPFTQLFRPLGAVIYRMEFAMFGLHPLPFRIVVYVLLLLNAWLVFRLAKRLTGSSEIGVLAAFFMSFHQRLGEIYANNGTIYDVICCTFYCSALLYYIRVRNEERFRAAEYLALYALVVATVNSKEIGATLPVMLLAYELIYHRPSSWRWLRDAGPVWMAAAVVALSLWRKIGENGGPFKANVYYAPQFSLERYFATAGRQLDNLFWQPDGRFTAAGVLGLFSLLIVIALIARRKHIWWCTLFILIGPLPVNFITVRTLYAIYVVLIAWSIYAASLLVESRDWLYARIWKRPALPAATWEPERVFLFLVIVMLLWNVQSHDTPIPWEISSRRMSPIHSFRNNFHNLNPKLGAGSRILLLDDPFSKDEWTPVTLLRMMYREPDITVDRVKWMDHRPQGAQLDGYNHVYDYRGDRLVEVGVTSRSER